MSKGSRFFSLMVIGDGPEGITDKYSLNSTTYQSEPYVKYKYLDAEKYKKTSIKALRKILDESDKIGIPDNIIEQLTDRLKILEDMSSFEYYRELTDGMYYDENGNALSDENPNAKFDTCRMGGNFSMPLILKDGTETYQAQAKDIDWGRMNGVNEEVYKAAWELVMEGREPVTDEEKTIYNSMKDKESYFEKFNTKEEYVSRSTKYWTYAYVDRNIGWHSVDDEINEISWINGFYDKFIKNIDPEELVTICECSIQD